MSQLIEQSSDNRLCAIEFCKSWLPSPTSSGGSGELDVLFSSGAGSTWLPDSGV